MSKKYVTREEFEELKSKLSAATSTVINTEVPSSVETNVKKAQRLPTKYNLFVRDESKKIREQNPGIKAPDVMKKCGEVWKAQKEEQNSVDK